MLQVSGLPAKTLHPPIKLKDGIRAAARDNERHPAKQQDCADVDLDDLVFRVAAAFRGHPHLNNVLTHISGANWHAVEKALHVILDPREGNHDLSPLARNIVDLMCADRGVTGRILKPFYRERLVALLGDRVASRLIAHVTSLFLESEAAVRTVKKATPADAPTDVANERAI